VTTTQREEGASIRVGEVDEVLPGLGLPFARLLDLVARVTRVLDPLLYRVLEPLLGLSRPLFG
jgi:hypothetical protein